MKLNQSKKVVPALYKCSTFFNAVYPIHRFVTKHTCFYFLRISFLSVFIIYTASTPTLCEIKNGYEQNILTMKESLRKLTDILVEQKNLSGLQRRKIESKAMLLIKYISYYDLTESLLNEFRIISPKLYTEIDTVRDRQGRAIDVYVKFVPVDATKVKAFGTTYLNQMRNDKDGYLSEYGPLTVSVKIWIVSNALTILAHELGHVKYQVPNLARYITYYKKHYDAKMSNCLGHSPDDPSGKAAAQYEKLFRREFEHHSKISNRKIQSPAIVLNKIRKSMSPKHYAILNTSKPTVTLSRFQAKL